MTIDLLLISVYLFFLCTAWIGFSIYNHKLRKFIIKVHPIYKEALGLAWEKRKCFEYMMQYDSFKLKLIKANITLLPESMHENYKSLSNLRTIAYLNLIASFFIIFFGHSITTWLRT